MQVQLAVVTLLLAQLPTGSPAAAQQASGPPPAPVAAAAMPEALDPQAALAAMRPRAGFTVELVAAEPLVMDPVAFAWGADLKLWVVEMADYPLGLDGKGQPGGRIRYLEDTDGDGRYDRSTLFLEGLSYPTGVMPWRRGVLVTCAPDILYAEDRDGDGRADVREVLYSGFSEGNPQHRMNGLRWGLDNWVHCANAQSRGVVRSTKTGEQMDIGGRDFRIRPDEGLLDTVAGRSQFMRERDDWGNWFGNTNSNPLFHIALDDHYQRRNAHLAPPSHEVPVAAAAGAAPVFPASRTLERFNDLSRANRFTSACSAIIYRDELLGADYAGNSFVCEPVHNLVHREVLAPAGTTFRSRRADDEQDSEFLASTDNWFRPAMVRSGPDGALWVADMYRLVIEHPQWIPQEWQERLDLRAGDDKGRIYRVFPAAARPRPVRRLDTLGTAELVGELEHPSGTWRDVAHRLLLERNDPAAVDLLRRAAREGYRPTCRLHALCVLDGLSELGRPDALDEATLLAALDDEHAGVRRHGIRLAERLLNARSAISAAVVRLSGDDDAQVRMQAAWSLGQWRDPAAGRVLGRMAAAEAGDRFLTAAILSSLTRESLPAAVEVITAERANALKATALLEPLLTLAVALKCDDALARLLDTIAAPDDSGALSGWQYAAARGFLESLERRKLTPAALADAAERPLAKALGRLDEMLARAAATAEDAAAEESLRVAAVGTLGRSAAHRREDLALLAGLLSPQTPLGVQAAAVAALARQSDPQAAEALLSGWKGFGPEVRRQALAAVTARSASAAALLDRIEGGLILAGEIDAAATQHLLEHKEPSIRDRAAGLLTAAASDRRQVVENYQSSLSMGGDARRGGEVFSKSCAACHRLGGAGHAVGPDLAALADKSPGSLLLSILDPNRAVEARFFSYTAVTRDGLVHTGLLSEESGTSVTLAAAEGKQTVILRSELEALASSSKSLMPEGVEREISPEAMADLLAYLGQVRAPRKVFAGNVPQLVQPELLRGEYYLLAETAEIYGSTLEYEPRYQNLGHWRSGDDHASWSLEVRQGGVFEVSLEYACAEAQQGNAYVLTVGSQRLTGNVPGTGNWETYRQLTTGSVKLEPGIHQLVIRGDGQIRGALFDLKAVRLRPQPTR